MKKLLVVVDYQNDFVDGSLGFIEAKHIEQNIIKRINQFISEGQKVCFTKDVHEENYLTTVEGQHLPVGHCIVKTRGIDLFGEVAKLENLGKTFYKNTFGSSELAKYISMNFFDEIALVGVVTNICVLANAIVAKTFSPNSRILVYKDAVASNDEKMQEKTFEILKNVHVEIV